MPFHRVMGDNCSMVAQRGGLQGKEVDRVMSFLRCFVGTSALFAIVGASTALSEERSPPSSSVSMPTAKVPAAVGGSGWRNYPYPYYQTIGPDGRPITILPPMPPLIVPAVLVPVAVPQPPANGGNFGLAGPLPRGGVPTARSLPGAAKKKVDPGRASQLVTFGDRLFRGGNTRKAEERYQQAARANPNSAAPQVRLAQLALVRSHYGEAADHLRTAQAAEPGWVTNVDDIQSIYSEPADFAKQIAKLESHLQANPGDRDAWLVLGAQWYLSGRTQKAADIFLRLSDRQPDAALEAFIEASRLADPTLVR